ncbi:hypothetical protein GBAR_LOCUS11350 [Geodia barretti]|uniref:Uncharacterized protein n=1 Tax=Geodia barretti TaxID=519541 RepID=A0AA35WLG9_GEOBA|nr:hypothetical protein GBAR_LOCUS11350 [Geodia barretti]
MSDVANTLSVKLTTAEVPNTRAGDAALSISTSLTVANTSFDGGDTKVSSSQSPATSSQLGLSSPLHGSGASPLTEVDSQSDLPQPS